MANLNELSQIIRTPGEGLIAFTSGAGLAHSWMAKYFSDLETASWAKTFLTRVEKNKVGLLGVPSDIGGGICRGAAHGPLHLRRTLFVQDEKFAKMDLGDVPCIPQLLEDEMLSKSQLKKSGLALWGKGYNSEKHPVSVLNILEETLVAIWKKNKNFVPHILGGDHSLSYAVMRALHVSKKTKGLGVLHFDAHSDLMESRLGIDHCFATWASHAIGMLKDPESFVQVGVRISAKTKKEWESLYGHHQYWSEEVEKLSAKAFCEKVFAHWKKTKVQHIYISNDIDGTNPVFAPSTGTPHPGGLHPDWVCEVLERVCEEFPLVASDLMEVAPVLGSEEACSTTCKTAARYLTSLL